MVVKTCEACSKETEANLVGCQQCTRDSTVNKAISFEVSENRSTRLGCSHYVVDVVDKNEQFLDVQQTQILLLAVEKFASVATPRASFAGDILPQLFQ